MKMSKVAAAIVLSILSGLSSGTAQAALVGTATTVCPELFLVTLNNFDQHLKLEKQGMPGEFMDEYNSVIATLDTDPNMINCVDDTGDTPLTYVFNHNYNLCTLPSAADYFLAHGAQIDMPEPSLGNTPLYYAIESYGYIYGTPRPIELSDRDICAEDVPQTHFKSVIQSLIAKGADINHAGKYDQSVPQVAAALQVTDLLH